MVRAHHRDRAGQLVGLLRARLGRLVVLGSGRERLVHAVARRNRPAPLRDRGGEAEHAEGLDRAARDPHLRALSARHFPGAFGGSHLGSRLRHRSRPRRLHPRPPDPGDRRRARALRRPRAGAQGGRAVRAGLARGRVGAQQPAARHGGRDRAPGHAVSADPRCCRRRQGLGGSALFRGDVRTDHGAAADREYDRRDPRVEAGRSFGRVRPPLDRAPCRRRGHRSGGVACGDRRSPRRLRARPRRLAVLRSPGGVRREDRGRPGSAGNGDPARA